MKYSSIMRRLLLLLLILAIFTIPEILLANPNTFNPASGPVCSEVTIIGEIPAPPYNELHVAFNKVESVDVRIGVYKNTHVFPPKLQRAIIAAVPGEASTGPIVVRVSPFLSAPGSTETLTFSKPFIVTGPTLRQPVITSFSATPNEIYSVFQGSTLRWSIQGPTTSVVLNGQNHGLHLNGKYYFDSSRRVYPAATTTYTLTAGNGCPSVSSKTLVDVEQPILQTGDFRGKFEFTHAQMAGQTSPENPMNGACFAQIAGPGVRGAGAPAEDLATLSCPGTGIQPHSQTFHVVGEMGGGSALGGVDSYLSESPNQVFVVADLDPIGENFVDYYTFELPQQLSFGGFKLVPPSPAAYGPCSLSNPQTPAIPSIQGCSNSPGTFRVYNYVSHDSSGAPSFQPSVDGVLGLITWNLAQADATGCLQEYALYNLLSGTVVRYRDFNEGAIAAKVVDSKTVDLTNAKFSPCNESHTEDKFAIQ